MVTETALFALQDQVKYFKEKSKANSKLFSENVALKAKMRDLENMSLVTSGTKEQVEEMMRNHQSVESLSLMVVVLKK